MRFATMLALLLSPLLACGEDKPPSPIRLPISVTPVVPSAVTELSRDAIFVVESDVPCIVLASREGYVTVTQEAGPLRMRGHFADGKGIETRNYTAKHLFIVEATNAGEVELLVVPAGAKDAASVVRRTLVVLGAGPRPPPAPDPLPPGPTPPQPAPVVSQVSLVVIHDVKAITPATAIVLNSTAAWNEFTKAGSEWQFFDRTSKEPLGVKALSDAAGVALPALIIYDRTSRVKLAAVPLPTSVEALRATVAKYAGGK